MEESKPSSPTFFLFSACGDPYKGPSLNRGAADLETQLITQLTQIEESLGLNSHPHCLFHTLRPYQTYFTDYDPSQQHREAITFLLRIGRNRHALTVILRIHLASLSAIAVLTARQPTDLHVLRSLCASNTSLLRTTPLGFLSLILEQRAAMWEQWVIDLYLSTNEIESIQDLAPHEFISFTPSEERKRELTSSGFEGMLRHLSGTHVQICHGLNVIESGVRFAAFCKEALGVVHGQAGAWGMFGGGLRPGEWAMLEERIRGSLARCEGVRDRFVEMGERHRGHIGQIYNRIAQNESKTNRAVAEVNLDMARFTASDSRTMKSIAFLELIFLPAIFIATLWGAAGIIELDDKTNRNVFVGAILGLTLAVLCFWGLYMRWSRKALGQGHRDALKANLGIV